MSPRARGASSRSRWVASTAGAWPGRARPSRCSRSSAATPPATSRARASAARFADRERAVRRRQDDPAPARLLAPRLGGAQARARRDLLEDDLHLELGEARTEAA